MEALKNIAKATIVMFAVGALLGLAAPHLANAIGPGILGQAAYEHALGTSVAWSGAFFGAFGGIHAAVEPALGAIFGGKKEAVPAPQVAKNTGKDHPVVVMVQDCAPEQKIRSESFTAMIEAQRAAPRSEKQALI